MTRIISGEWGGRRLRTPAGDGTRPTTDRVREALFSSLESELGGFAGLHVLDMFAGSGALGLEALSRGAASATFVESHARVASVIKANIRELGCADQSTVLTTSASRFVAGRPVQPFDLLLLDPPYEVPSDEVSRLVASLAPPTWRADDSLIVVERSTRGEFHWPEGVIGVRDRAYGETHLWYGR